MKKPNVANAISLGLVVLTFLMTVLAYPHLPELVPSHWNVHGEIDGWLPKPFGPFALPIVMAVTFAILLAVPRISPKGFTVEGFRPAYAAIQVAILAVLMVITGAAHLAGMGEPISVPRIIQGAVGVLFVVIGNYLGKVTRNFMVGIRTPWTLADDEVWLRTHRLGGRLMVLAGLVSVACAIFNVVSPWVMVSVVVLAAVLPIGFSYVIYRRLDPKGPDGGNGPVQEP